jgi:hypothetical protein
MEGIHTSTFDDSSGTSNETSEKINEKIGNEETSNDSYLGTWYLPSLNLYNI